MSVKMTPALIEAIVVAGCSGGTERPAGEGSVTAAVHTRDSTGRPDSAGGAGMAGMDHSGMAGMARHAPPSKGGHGAATMEHAPGHSSPNAQGRASVPAAGHGGMGHPGMPGMRHDGPSGPNADAAMGKLRALVAELVEDPVVQAQIQVDTALRRRWADQGVRRVLLDRP